MLFLGCSDDSTLVGGNAFIAVLSIKKGFGVVHLVKYNESSEYYLITLMRRMENSNLLFVGTSKFVVVLLWNKKELVKINQIECISPLPVTDMSLRDNLLFAVNDDTKGTVIHFNDDLIKNRDPRLNNYKIESFQRRALNSAMKTSVNVDAYVTSFVRNQMGGFLTDKIDAKIGELPIETANKRRAALQPRPSFLGPLSTPPSRQGNITSKSFEDLNPKKIDSDDEESEREVVIANNANSQLFKSRASIVPQGSGMGASGNLMKARPGQASAQPKNFQRYQGSSVTKLNLQEYSWKKDTLTKIDYSLGATTLVCGYQYINILTSDSRRYMFSQLSGSNNSISDVTVMPSGEFLIFEQKSADIVKYDPRGSEISRKKNQYSSKPRISAQFRCNMNTSSDFYIWPSSSMAVSSVNQTTMEVRELRNVFKGVESETREIQCIVNSKNYNLAILLNTGSGQNLLYYSLMSEENSIKGISSMQGGGRVTLLIGGGGVYYCMECSTNGQVLFLGGGTTAGGDSDARVLCVAFSEKMTVIDELTIQDKVERKMRVECMRKDSERDVLYCGVFQDVYVVEWAGSNLCILRCFDNIHSSTRESSRCS